MREDNLLAEYGHRLSFFETKLKRLLSLPLLAPLRHAGSDFCLTSSDMIDGQYPSGHAHQ
jgi:hypothetical protein